MVRRPIIDSTVVVDGGRRIGYADFGPGEGRPLIYLHGHPGSRLDLGRDDLLEPLAAAGYRLIAFDRPGFGRSEFVPGRTHADWAEDLEQAVDALGIGRFALLAYSRGGLFGLACAARFHDRLDDVFLLSPIAPREMPGWWQSWRRDLRLLYTASRRAPALTRALQRANAKTMGTERGAVRAFSRFMRSPVDSEQLRAHPDWCLLGAREASRQDQLGLVEDAGRLIEWPLSFSLDDVATPVRLWHGDADNLVPLSHSRFYASRLPRAELVEVAGHGHAPTAKVLSSIASYRTAPESSAHT